MRFPLALAVVLLVATSLPATAGPKAKRVDWAARAKAVTFKFDAPNVLDAAGKVYGYDVVLVHDGKTGKFGDYTIRLESAGKTIYAFPGHRETPLVVVDEMLYLSDHDPIGTGAMIVAVDLKTGTEKWRTTLTGLAEAEDARARRLNWVQLEVSDVITVLGMESGGSYVELVDRKTGASLATDIRSTYP